MDNDVANYDSDIDISFFNMTQQQMTFECCGKSGPSDYKKRPNKIPGSCCRKPDIQSCRASEAFTKGCNEELQIKLDKALLSMALSALGIAFFHILMIVFACYYTRSKKQMVDYQKFDGKNGECVAMQGGPQVEVYGQDDSDCCFC